MGERTARAAILLIRWEKRSRALVCGAHPRQVRGHTRCPPQQPTLRSASAILARYPRAASSLSPMRALGSTSLALVLAIFASASVPSFETALEACAGEATHTGTCAALPSSSVCDGYFAAGELMYVPTGMTIGDIETSVIGQMGSAIINKAFFSSECFNYTINFVCNTHYYRCVASDNASEPLPILVCADYCSNFWKASICCCCCRVRAVSKRVLTRPVTCAGMLRHV